MTKSFGELFGELIKQRRMLEELTQLQLAIEAFDDETKVRRIAELESGKVKNPRVNTIGPICAKLGITEEELTDLRQRARSPAQNESDSTRPDPGPSQSQPRLSPPPPTTNINHYGARSLEMLGREMESSRLREFLAVDAPFAWLQLAGFGGQGKSRLALELSLSAQAEGWAAGLLETEDLEEFGEAWSHWQPDRPHLIVLDYIVGREPKIGPVFRMLARRERELRAPVRLLLLERQRWDRGSLWRLREGQSSTKQALVTVGSEGRADWFLKLVERHDGNDRVLMETMFDTGVLELRRLDRDALVTIVRHVAQLGETEIDLTNTAIAKQLERIDAAGRPLYAYFLGQALVSGSRHEGWTRDDLLDAVLDRDHATRWASVFDGTAPSLGDDDPAVRIAVTATITRGLDCKAVAKQGLLPQADATTRRRALVLTDGPLGVGARGPGQLVPPLQPDVLGEWFVLAAFEEGLPTSELLDIAWRYAPAEVAAFLRRLSQDFPDRSMTTAMFEQELPDEASADALAKVAAAIIADLNHAKRPFPNRVIEALKAAAEAGDGLANFYLGLCHLKGRGVTQDLEAAVRCYQRGAEAGDAHAMASLGYCYDNGYGVAQDLEAAVRWFRRAAEAGFKGSLYDPLLLIQLVINDKNEVFVFHNRQLGKKPLSFLEFYTGSRALNFVLKGGEILESGGAVPEKYARHMRNAHQIMMVQMDDEGDPISGDYFPLILHSG